VRAFVGHRPTAPQRGDHVQSLVEAVGPLPRPRGLTERGELVVGRKSEADADDHPAPAEVVERHHLLGELVWSSAGQRRHHRPEPHSRRDLRDRAEDHPGVVHVEPHFAEEVDVVPQEDPVPPVALGLDGDVDEPLDASHVRQAQAVAHASKPRAPRVLTRRGR
jgi:hypothetical protein